MDPELKMRHFQYVNWVELFKTRGEHLVSMQHKGITTNITLDELYQHFKDRMEYEQMIEKGGTG